MTIEYNGNGDNQRALVFCEAAELTASGSGYVLSSMEGLGDGSLIFVADNPRRVLMVYDGVGYNWGDSNA